MIDPNSDNSARLRDADFLSIPWLAASLCKQIEILRPRELFHAVFEEKNRDTRLSLTLVRINCSGVECK